MLEDDEFSLVSIAHGFQNCETHGAVFPCEKLHISRVDYYRMRAITTDDVRPARAAKKRGRLWAALSVMTARRCGIRGCLAA
jgi:hypothetical protein